ncbi:MAG TPA: hypothetical protein P5205_20365 [Candidatus Paceibacterota bacterium]|nr:hypothetical protein [Verrucomicrobiota bacterium]HSA12721.1 hypothetical protein [Candidatus Paceibacterota bacterium]
MTRSIWIIAGILGVLISPGLRARAETHGRVIPRALPPHPGNIFLRGEAVVVEAAVKSVPAWRVVDYEGRMVAEGRLDDDGRARLGKLPVGYYEVLSGGGGAGTNRVTVGVLEPLRAPTPLSSPIATDLGMAWFFPPERMAAPANLCALAGINWVRDRLSWPELEPKRGEFAPSNRYDASAQAQAAAGLQVLQVGHASAPWANPNGRRFPLDLRDIHRFYREMARRWQGQVGAIEPWNEADIEVFGGHTGSEMASLQKAAYLGLKEGNPKVIACLNVFAIHRAATLRDFQANEAWGCFDTYNLHCYEQLQGYPEAFADHRAVSAGKPLWVTEISVRVKWEGDEKLRELSAENLRLQAERLTKTYALSLHQGAAQVFYFILPQYSEGAVQFGLLHGDLTPRPGYVALAAVGRLLADARPLGRVELGDKAGQAYFFSARPDGKAADVAVAWAKSDRTWELPGAPQACYDHLGRAVRVTGRTLPVGRAPVLAVFPTALRPKLIPPPRPAGPLAGEAAPVVLQALLPEADTVLKESAYRFGAARAKSVPVFLYNFGANKTSGRLRVTAPEGWAAQFPPAAELSPGERKELTLALTRPETNAWTEAAIRIAGDFGPEGKPVLALQFVPK